MAESSLDRVSYNAARRTETYAFPSSGVALVNAALAKYSQKVRIRLKGKPPLHKPALTGKCMRELENPAFVLFRSLLQHSHDRQHDHLHHLIGRKPANLVQFNRRRERATRIQRFRLHLQ